MLGKDTDELGCKQIEGSGCFAFEQVGKSFEGIGDAAAVEGGNDEMAGFRGMEGGYSRFLIADFADKEDVRTLAQRGPQTPRKIRRILTNLPL